MANPNVTVDRHKYTGGSDLPNILGYNNKYGKSVFEFAKEKAGIKPSTFKGNQFTRYGQLLEPVIRDWLNANYSSNYVEDTIIDTVRMYRGNCDGIDREAVVPIIEIKTFGEELDVEYYEPQCQFYMNTFNQDAVRLVGYKRPKDFYTGIDYDLESDDSYFNLEFDENNIVEHIILRDEEKWSRIEERINAFKNAVDELRKRPEMSEDEFNSIFYGMDLVAVTNKITLLENQLKSLKQVEDDYKKAKEKLYRIFDEKGIIYFDTPKMKITKVAPTCYNTESIDTKKLKEKEPQIYEEYKTIKTTARKGYILITNKEEK